jgi:hypothetical protein
LQLAKSPSRSHKNALKSAHFVLSALPPSPQALLSKSLVADGLVIKIKANTLFKAIPKRLLKRAVDRNAVKRVCREVWRSECRTLLVNPENTLKLGAEPKLLKLVSRPNFDSTKQLKRLIRADLDVLFLKRNEQKK